MQQVVEATSVSVVPVPAAAVDNPRAFARGVVVGAALSAPAWAGLALAVQAVFR